MSTLLFHIIPTKYLQKYNFSSPRHHGCRKVHPKPSFEMTCYSEAGIPKLLEIWKMQHEGTWQFDAICW